jgi:hypothetical protein
MCNAVNTQMKRAALLAGRLLLLLHGSRGRFVIGCPLSSPAAACCPPSALMTAVPCTRHSSWSHQPGQAKQHTGIRQARVDASVMCWCLFECLHAVIPSTAVRTANICGPRTWACCEVWTTLLLGAVSSAHSACLQLLTSFFQSLSVLRPPATTTLGDEGPDVAKLLMFCSNTHHWLLWYMGAVSRRCWLRTMKILVRHAWTLKPSAL